MFVFALLSFICFTYSSEVNTQATGRFLTYGQSGVNNDCYIVSARYQTRPAAAEGDVFAAAMGTSLGGFPWTAMGYVKGSVDLDYYANRTLEQVTIDAQAAVAAWAFVALGEFCDKDGREGFQSGTSDYIMNYIYAPFGAPYTQQCGQTIDPVSGLPSFYSTVQSNPAAGTTNSNFNTSCYVFPDNAARAGRTVDSYTIKCDVRIDYSNLWTLFNPLACPDSQRKIGLLVNVAGAAFDADVTIDSNFNRVTSNTPDAERITFGRGALSFVWDNYITETSSFSGVTGTSRKVTYGYLENNGTQSSYRGAAVVQQVIFSFATPKSAGKNTFYWDPSITANPDAGVASLVPYLGMILALLSAIFLF